VNFTGAKFGRCLAFIFIGIAPSLGFSQDQPTSSAHSLQKLLKGAYEQTKETYLYDPAYVALSYPGGDIPRDRGVCSDVVIRAFRQAGVDLQVELHQDMKRHFSQYPKIWGLSGPDTNIDHRRVPNLMTFFKRMGKALPISASAADYQPGDIVAWRLTNGLLHMGVISDRNVASSDTPMVIHNIGSGAMVEDILFKYEILGHYRYF